MHSSSTGSCLNITRNSQEAHSSVCLRVLSLLPKMSRERSPSAEEGREAPAPKESPRDMLQLWRREMSKAGPLGPLRTPSLPLLACPQWRAALPGALLPERSGTLKQEGYSSTTPPTGPEHPELGGRERLWDIGWVAGTTASRGLPNLDLRPPGPSASLSTVTWKSFLLILLLFALLRVTEVTNTFFYMGKARPSASPVTEAHSLHDHTASPRWSDSVRSSHLLNWSVKRFKHHLYTSTSSLC